MTASTSSGKPIRKPKTHRPKTSKTSKTSISLVIPTYNEAKNVKQLAERIFKAWPRTEIVFVDDNSPDGTADIIQSRLMKKHEGRVKLLRREGKLGLSSAVIEGFRKTTNNVIGVIDADLSHPPETIPKLVQAIDSGADIAVASRYIKGGGISGWPWHRRTISTGATMLARPLTNVRDPMSGFFLLRKDVIKGAPLNAKGYKILLEVLVKGRYEKNRVVEIPFTFTDRIYGESKLGSRVFIQYLLDLRKQYRYKYRYRFFGKRKRFPGKRRN